MWMWDWTRSQRNSRGSFAYSQKSQTGEFISLWQFEYYCACWTDHTAELLEYTLLCLCVVRHLKLSGRLLVEAWSVPAPPQPAARAELGFGAGSRSQWNTIKSLCYWEMCSLDAIGRDLSADSAPDTDYSGALCHFSAGLRTSVARTGRITKWWS